MPLRALVAALLLHVSAAGVAHAAVSWNSGESGPDFWNIACDDADCTGAITFSGPTATYGNECQAVQAAGGTLELVIDESARTIAITATPPAPAGCPGIYVPVTGLTGEFGPLAAGRWRFFSDTPVADFELEFEVPPAESDGAAAWLADGEEPDAWALACPDGTCEGVIEFLGPVPMQFNSCAAEQAAGGTPVLTVDEANRRVELWFSAPAPSACPLVFDPVGGLGGSFGPLAPGEWALHSDSALVQFNLRFLVPQGGDGSVDWIGGDSPPPSWTATCDDAECSGDFSFSGPTPVYTNACGAELAAGGMPVLSIRPEIQAVELWFSQPAPLACPLLFDPVAGLTGSLEGLSPGTWSFYGAASAASFQQILEVGNASLNWIEGAPGPEQWGVDCADPTCTGIIGFSGPTATYGNACEANQAVGGVPVLRIDAAQREIEVLIAPPVPVSCPGIFQPVAGLAGTFGPLEAGEWRFYSEAGFSDFDLTFNVADASCLEATIAPEDAAIPAAGGTGSFTIDAEELCACEATVEGDFVTITSNPTIACELGTVTYTVAPNPGEAREASITLSGNVVLKHSISQAAAGGEGEGESVHSTDINGDNVIGLSELLRLIQFYNSPRFGCELGTEDGYAPNATDETCPPHAADYNPQDWQVVLTELLRVIQFYNSGGYTGCPGEGTEDGYCVGPPGK